MIRQDIKVAVDAVVFGYKDRTLNVLLIKIIYRNIRSVLFLHFGYVSYLVAFIGYTI